MCLVWSRRCWFWPVSYDGCCWLSSYLAFCLLQLQSSRCRQIYSNRAPHQITNIRFGGEKQNKAICEWLGFSINRHVIIILTHRHHQWGSALSTNPHLRFLLSLSSPTEKFKLMYWFWSDNLFFPHISNTHWAIRLSTWPQLLSSVSPNIYIKIIIKANRLQPRK